MMSRISDVFQFERPGRQSVVRVNPDGIGDYARVEQCCKELARSLAEAGCRLVAFNIENAPFLPSGVLGLLISMRQSGAEVEFRNASAHVREAMQATKLDQLASVYPAAAS